MNKAELKELIKECVREIIAEQRRPLLESNVRLSNAIWDSISELNPQNKPNIGFPTKKFLKLLFQHYGKKVNLKELLKFIDELNMKSRWANIKVTKDGTYVSQK